MDSLEYRAKKVEAVVYTQRDLFSDSVTIYCHPNSGLHLEPGERLVIKMPMEGGLDFVWIETPTQEDEDGGEND